MHPGIIDTLKKNQLSITESRKRILDMFLQQKGALLTPISKTRVGMILIG